MRVGGGGETVVIRKQVEFAQRILPQFFSHSNLQSFVRQVCTKYDTQLPFIFLFCTRYYQGVSSSWYGIINRVFGEFGLGFLWSVSHIQPIPTREKRLLGENVAQRPLLT